MYSELRPHVIITAASYQAVSIISTTVQAPEVLASKLSNDWEQLHRLPQFSGSCRNLGMASQTSQSLYRMPEVTETNAGYWAGEDDAANATDS